MEPEIATRLVRVANVILDNSGQKTILQSMNEQLLQKNSYLSKELDVTRNEFLKLKQDHEALEIRFNSELKSDEQGMYRELKCNESIEKARQKIFGGVNELEDCLKETNVEKTNLMRKLQIMYKRVMKYLMTEREILRQKFDSREGLILFLLACINSNMDPDQLENCIKRTADNKFPDLKQLICKSGELVQIKMVIDNFKTKQAVSDQIENYEELLTSLTNALHGVNILPAGLVKERKELRRYLAKIAGVKRTAKQESDIEDNDEEDRQYHNNISSSLSDLDPKFNYRSPLLINTRAIRENILSIKKKFMNPTLKQKLAVARKATQRQRSGQQTKQETKPLDVVTTENSRKSTGPTRTRAGSHPLKPSTPKKATKDTIEEGDQTTEFDLTNDLNLSDDDSDFETETVETKAVKKARQSCVKSKIGDPTIPVAVTSASCEKSKLEQHVKQAKEKRATVGEKKVKEEEEKKKLVASVVEAKAAQNTSRSRSKIIHSLPLSEEPEPGTSNPKDVIPKLISNAKTTKIPTTKPEKYVQELREIVNEPSFGEKNNDGVLSLELPDDDKQTFDSPLSPPNLTVEQDFILQNDNQAYMFMTKNFVHETTAEVQDSVQRILDSLRTDEYKRLPAASIARSMIRLIGNTKLQEMQQLSDYWDVLVEVVHVARGRQVNLTKLLLNEFKQNLVFDKTGHFDGDVLFAKYGSFFGFMWIKIKTLNQPLQHNELERLLRDCLYWRPKSVFSFAYELSRQYPDYIEMITHHGMASRFKKIVVFTFLMDSEFSRDERHGGKRLQNLFRNGLKLKNLFAGMTLDEFVSVTMQEFKKYEHDAQINELVKFLGALCIHVDWNWLVQFIKATVVELIKDFKENKITNAIVTSFFNMIENIVHDRRNWGDVTVLVYLIRPLLDIQHEDSKDIKTAIQACFKKVEEKQKNPIPFATGNYVRPTNAKTDKSKGKITKVVKSTGNAPGNKKAKSNNNAANNNSKGKKPANKAARNNNKAGQNSKKDVASRNQKNMEVTQLSTTSLASASPSLEIDRGRSRKREASDQSRYSSDPIFPKKRRNATRSVRNSSGDSDRVVQ